jgi:probable non-F420 flavinoid oxidoreductase
MIGFHCAHEQYSPSSLLRFVRKAGEAGFRAGMCSDHFHPWSTRQGHSGFAWSWLGAALQATSMSFGTVCAPGQRYHPAVIAQAAATLAEMYPQRFWLAIGSGEALNEAITGQAWPAKSDRNARLRECADIMRALWAGDTVTTAGRVPTRSARLFTRPAEPPLLIGAALTPETARWMGGWVDGLITVAGPRDSMRQVIDAFREGGGGEKPLWLQVALAYARTEEHATRAAHDQWRHCVVPLQQLSDLTTPQEFDAACEAAHPENVAEKVRASADISRHVEWLQQDLALGYDRVFLHNVVREEQERFIDACAEHLLPQVSGDVIRQ